MRPDNGRLARGAATVPKPKAVPAVSHLIEARRRLPPSASHYATLIDMLIATVGERATAEAQQSARTRRTTKLTGG